AAARQIEPQRRPGEPGVADRTDPRPPITGVRDPGLLRRGIPAEPPGGIWRRGIAEELLYDRGAPSAARPATDGVEDRRGEPGDIADRGEQPRVTAYAPRKIRILVVDDAGNQTAIVELGRDRERQRRRARIARAAEAKRLGDS